MIIIPRKKQLPFFKYYERLEETGSLGGGVFFSFSRKANVAVMNSAFDMGKLIRETLYVLQIAI